MPEFQMKPNHADFDKKHSQVQNMKLRDGSNQNSHPEQNKEPKNNRQTNSLKNLISLQNERNQIRKAKAASPT